MIRTRFVCSSCGYESGKWLGRCPDCSSWNTFTEGKIEQEGRKSSPIIDLATSSEPIAIGKIKSSGIKRFKTGFSELDRVLGGGIVAGSAILLSGDPGIGKSTLLLEVARNIAGDKKVLYVSGEESEGQIKIRAERIGVGKNADLLIFANGDIDQVIKAAQRAKPELLMIDSIQAMSSSEFPGFAGSLPQLRHATSRIVSYAKRNNVPAFIVGHVTKEGEVAGPMLLSHMVDCVLYLEGESPPAGGTGTKILRAFKNRFGDTSEVGIFTMEERGLVEISDTSNYFRQEGKVAPGSCLTVVMEGSRPLIVEIQALVVPSNLSFPRRVSNGIADKRLELLLAVIQKHIKVPLDRMDVFINVVGGLKITETASDLAVCMAILSSFKNQALKSSVAIAEVGLLGELKGVLNEKARVNEARKVGFKNILTAEFKNLGDIMKNLY